VLLAAGVAIAQVPPPPGTESIALEKFTGAGDSEAAGIAPGLGWMIESDAIALLTDDDGPYSDCGVIFVSWGERRAATQAEIDFQQTWRVDPATRVRPGRLINPTVILSGHSEFAGGVTHYKVELRRHPSGELISSIEGDASEDDYMDAMPARIARELLEQFCEASDEPESPRTYEGNLRYSAVSPGQSVTLSGRITWLEGDPGAGSFLASGRMNFGVTIECTRRDDNNRLLMGEAKFNGDVRFEGEMQFHVPADGRYYFALGTNWDDGAFVCNGITQPYGVLLVSPMCEATPENAS
jgi:hypothetical protein